MTDNSQGMWRPTPGQLVCIQHPDPEMRRLIAQIKPSETWKEFEPGRVKFRVERLIDYPDGGVEAVLQPEVGTYPEGTTHTLYTSWLAPAPQP